MQGVQAGLEDVGDVAFVDEHRGLPRANGELRAILDLVLVAWKAPHHGVGAILVPLDDVNEFALELVEKRHAVLLCADWIRVGPAGHRRSIIPAGRVSRELAPLLRLSRFC